MTGQWIPVEKIQPLIQIEVISLLFVLLPLAFIIYNFFLKKISEKRHLNLKQRFTRTTSYLLITTLFAILYWVFIKNTLANYISMFALIFGVITVIKLAQIYVYLYLFLMNMSMGVPRVIANMFTLVFSLVIVSWLAADVFGFHFAAVLTTSAVFSLVLGLALQDTLGNLFSGIALQIDRPFNLGDWIEVHNGADKLTGNVQEISWRATTLTSFADELILIPNRVIAQAQLINYSNSQKAVRLNQIFRFRFDASIPLAKKSLMDGLVNIPDILTNPAPRTLITEVTESWVTIKIFYSLQDYGKRYVTGDLIINQILDQIHKNHLTLAGPTLNLMTNEKENNY